MKTLSHPPATRRAFGLMLLLGASLILASCASLNLKKQYYGTPEGITRHRYLTNGVSGAVVTADESIGVFALASVSMRGRGSLKLTFYRLTSSREPLAVRKVRVGRIETMTEGREVQFNDEGVSNAVQGRFNYSSYYQGIPIQVEFSSGERTWSREIHLSPSIGPSYIEAIRASPKAPESVTEFRALQRPASPYKPSFAATERP